MQQLKLAEFERAEVREVTISALEAKVLSMIDRRFRRDAEGWEIRSVFEGAEFGSREWKRAWAELVRITGDDPDAAEPETGETWQYMGAGRFAGEWVHSFRHRHHPDLKARWYVNVKASDEWIVKSRLR